MVWLQFPRQIGINWPSPSPPPVRNFLSLCRSLSLPSPTLRCLLQLLLLTIPPPLSRALASGVTGALPRSYYSPAPRSPSPSPLSSALKRGRQLLARGVVGSEEPPRIRAWRGTNAAPRPLPPNACILFRQICGGLPCLLCLLSRPPPTPFF